MARISASEDITIGVIQMHRVASVYAMGATLRIEDRDGTRVYVDAPSEAAALAIEAAFAGKAAPATIIAEAAS